MVKVKMGQLCVSVELMNAQIIDDALENGFSYSHAKETVNISCAKQGLQHVGIVLYSQLHTENEPDKD